MALPPPYFFALWLPSEFGQCQSLAASWKSAPSMLGHSLSVAVGLYLRPQLCLVALYSSSSGPLVGASNTFFPFPFQAYGGNSFPHTSPRTFYWFSPHPAHIPIKIHSVNFHQPFLMRGPCVS